MGLTVKIFMNNCAGYFVSKPLRAVKFNKVSTFLVNITNV